jgi:hypothetical protein
MNMGRNIALAQQRFRGDTKFFENYFVEVYQKRLSLLGGLLTVGTKRKITETNSPKSRFPYMVLIPSIISSAFIIPSIIYEKIGGC